MKATVNIETITPNEAKAALSNMIDIQRPLRQAWADSLTIEMREGKFRLSPDAILFVKGKLCNGQHRLTALIQANRSFQFLVMRSNDDELYKLIDSGVKRQVSDVLCSKHRTLVAAAAVLCQMWERQVLTAQCVGISRANLTRQQNVAWTQSHQSELERIADLVNPIYQKSKLFTPTIAVAAMFITPTPLRQDALETIRNVYDPSSTQTPSERLLHLKICQHLKRRSYRLEKGYILALLLKCIKARINGTTAVLTMADGEKMPRF